MASGALSRSLAAILAASMLQGWLFCQDATDSADRSLARIYVERADALHRAGQDGEALELLKESLSLSGRDPDALYLISIVDSRAVSGDYSLRASRIARLEAALALGGFSLYEREDAVYALADSLMAIREYDRAAQAVRDGIADPWLEARAAFALVACEYYAGRIDAYRADLAACFRRFPDDARFARFFLERAKGEAAEEGLRPLRDSVMARLERLVAADPEILVLAVPFTSRKDDRVRLLRRYDSLGLGGRRALIEFQRYGIRPEAELVDEFWSDSGKRIRWDEAADFFGLLSSGAGRSEFLRRMEAFSGEIEEEESGDGIAEGFSRFESGELVRWESDPDQDGLVDVSAEFADGLPGSAKCLGQDGYALFEYSTYPELRSAAFRREGGTAKLSFGSGGLSLPLLSFKLPFRAEGLAKIRRARRDAKVAAPGFEAALPSAIMLEEEWTSDEGSGAPPRKMKAISELEGGMTLRYREFTDGKPSLSREYSRGLPAIERIGYDEAGGYWKGRILYERIPEPPYYAKASLALDEDSDGTEEYRELYRPFLRKEWDFDGNGSFDVAEEERDGTVFDHFSSKMNGDFDVTIEIRAGRIVSVLRYGKKYLVRKESKAEIYWIGEKPFELGASAPEADGVYGKPGKRYLFYRSGKMAFAERLP